MPAKAASQPKKSKAESSGGSSGGKAKKKKWSKGKVRDKLNNMVRLSSFVLILQKKTNCFPLGFVRQTQLRQMCERFASIQIDHSSDRL